MTWKYWLKPIAGLMDLLPDMHSIKKKITEITNRIVNFILHIYQHVALAEFPKGNLNHVKPCSLLKKINYLNI